MYDNKDTGYKNNMRQGHLQMAQLEIDCFVVINAEQKLDTVVQNMMVNIDDRYGISKIKENFCIFWREGNKCQ